LRHVQTPGSPAKVHFLGNRHEIAQLAQFSVHVV
jgi:hypothetical protein